MRWQTYVIIGAALWLTIRGFERILRVLLGIRDRLSAIQNTQTMLFYAVEQIYEMSGVYGQFKTQKAKECDVLRPEPVVDVEDEDSVAAWSTLMQRVQSRAETAIRLQFRERDDAEDPDQMFLRANQEGWLARLPKLRGWPEHPHTLWWGTGEKAPEGVPVSTEERD